MVDSLQQTAAHPISAQSCRVVLLTLLSFFIAGCGAKPKSDSDRKAAPAERASGNSSLPAMSAPPDHNSADTGGLQSLRPAAPLRTTQVPGSPRINDSALEPARQGFTNVRVFYATDRAATGRSQPDAFFGTQPGPLTFGFCNISIPQGHQRGELESPRIWRFEVQEDPRKHVVLMSVSPASPRKFITELQREVWDSIEWRESPQGPVIVGGEAFIFVHGFNNTFEEAARRTAQIAHDIKFRGAPILYSWPSQGSGSLGGYQADGRMADYSQQHLISFIGSVARETGARRIHLIAHSMGNRLVSEAIRRLSYHFENGEVPQFNEIILTAPDIDANYFKTAIAPKLATAAERVTIYASSKDLALKASSLVNLGGKRRLGDAGDELTLFPNLPNINMVDASDVDTSLFQLRHSYHADSPTILDDMQRVLAGWSIQDRGLNSLFSNLAWKLKNSRKSLEDALETIVR